MRPTPPRRLPLLATGATLLALLAPSTALAHGHRHGHHHNSRHARVSFKHLGPLSAVAPASAPSTAAASPPAGAPATETVGKIASYTGGVLTLTLNDNSTVSGKVTESTHIECTSATPGAGAQGDDSQSGDDNGAGDSHGSGSQDGQARAASNDEQGGEGNDANDEHDDEGASGGEPPCDASALVTGVLVRSAELRISASGTEFEMIELVR
jgi:hypothetical protein